MKKNLTKFLLMLEHALLRQNCVYRSRFFSVANPIYLRTHLLSKYTIIIILCHFISFFPLLLLHKSYHTISLYTRISIRCMHTCNYGHLPLSFSLLPFQQLAGIGSDNSRCFPHFSRCYMQCIRVQKHTSHPS
jgi:hypothetical protein